MRLKSEGRGPIGSERLQAEARKLTGALGAAGAAPFGYIRSAILKMSQPKKANPNSQKSDTATIGSPFLLFTGRIRFYRPECK
jgi:hypothetical protein